MSATYKPSGYTTVAPYLIVDGASRTIEFLSRVFDAVELRRMDDPSGKVLHAEIRIDDTVVMIADGVPDWPPIAAHVHVYVSDVDATYRRALAAGATSVQEPVKKQDEDKRGGVKDPGGTTWWIATRLALLVVAAVLQGCVSDAIGPQLIEMDALPRAIPFYPAQLRSINFEGEATVRVPLNPEGSPIAESLLVLGATQELFGKSATMAIRQWRFVPGERSVDVRIRYRLAKGNCSDSLRQFRFDERSATGELLACPIPGCDAVMPPWPRPTPPSPATGLQE